MQAEAEQYSYDVLRKRMVLSLNILIKRVSKVVMTNMYGAEEGST